MGGRQVAGDTNEEEASKHTTNSNSLPQHSVGEADGYQHRRLLLSKLALLLSFSSLLVAQSPINGAIRCCRIIPWLPHPLTR